VEARRGLVGTEDVVLEADAVEEVAPWRSTLVVPSAEVPAAEPGVPGVPGMRLTTSTSPAGAAPAEVTVVSGVAVPAVVVVDSPLAVSSAGAPLWSTVSAER
jgi:hypothetical protein